MSIYIGLNIFCFRFRKAVPALHCRGLFAIIYRAFCRIEGMRLQKCLALCGVAGRFDDEAQDCRIDLLLIINIGGYP